MGSKNLLLYDLKGNTITLAKMRELIADFSYKKATQEIIEKSIGLNKDGEVFAKCTARILSNFGMNRGGPFKGIGIARNGKVNGNDILLKCWNEIGNDLLEIRRSIPNSGYSRDRYLLELSKAERERLIARIWRITKQLLPLTMGETSYGLVGASKILFAVLPELVLPVDSQQWLKVFKTVDIGDVINCMAADIQEWEGETNLKLNEMDDSKMLTTLPSVYNVMAMHARPR